MKRFQVTIERDLIIYAEDANGARQQAKRHFEVNDGIAVRDVRVIATTELPPLKSEAHGPSVDIAPGMAVKK